MAVTIGFKGYQFPESMTLYAVFFYVHYDVLYRDVEKIMAERGAEIDHTQPNRCMVKFSPLNAAKALVRKNTNAVSRWMDGKYMPRSVVHGPRYMPRLSRRETLISCGQGAGPPERASHASFQADRQWRGRQVRIVPVYPI